MLKGGSMFQVTKITGVEWAISLALGTLPLLIGFLIRLIPSSRVDDTCLPTSRLRIDNTNIPVPLHNTDTSSGLPCGPVHPHVPPDIGRAANRRGMLL